MRRLWVYFFTVGKNRIQPPEGGVFFHGQILSISHGGGREPNPGAGWRAAQRPAPAQNKRKGAWHSG